MLIGSYGRFWERRLVDFDQRGWRLLGRRGLNTGTIKIADFRRATGIYVLYNEVGPYYVGLAAGEGGLGGRIKDHTRDDHEWGWSRFSWFAFEEAGDEAYPDGVLRVEGVEVGFATGSSMVIRDIEALLQIAIQPSANRNETRFKNGSEWLQVADHPPIVRTFSELRPRLTGLPPK